MKNRLSVAACLAGIALVSSACSSGSNATPGPGTAVPTPETSSASATGWEWNQQGSEDRIKAAGLSVLKAEGAAEHFHTHVDVFVDGKAVTVAPNIGFVLDSSEKPLGIAAMHSHDKSGIIHIEAPTVGATYTLGQFLTEWGVLDGASKSPGSAHSSIDGWTVTVNGTKQAGKVSDTVLKSHDEVVLSYGAAPDPMPASYKFPEGL